MGAAISELLELEILVFHVYEYPGVSFGIDGWNRHFVLETGLQRSRACLCCRFRLILLR